MKKNQLFVLVGLLSLALAGCMTQNPQQINENTTSPTPSNTPSSTFTLEPDNLKPTSTPKPTSSSLRTEVSWGDYQLGLQQNIDQFAAKQDCQGLQSFFGMITATEESMKANKGHGNEALEKYLNEAVALAGCG